MPSPAGVHEARPSPLPAASLLPLHTSQVYLLLIFKFCAARLRSCCCACSCDHEEVPTGSVLTAALPSAPGAKAQEPRGLITRAEGAGACAGPSGRMHLPSFRVGGTAPCACTSQPPGLRSTHPGAPVASPPADRMSLRDSPGGPRGLSCSLVRFAGPRGAGGRACSSRRGTTWGPSACHWSENQTPRQRLGPWAQTQPSVLHFPCRNRGNSVLTPGLVRVSRGNGTARGCVRVAGATAGPQELNPPPTPARRLVCSPWLSGLAAGGASWVLRTPPSAPRGVPRERMVGGGGCYPGRRHLPLHKCFYK